MKLGVEHACGHACQCAATEAGGGGQDRIHAAGEQRSGQRRSRGDRPFGGDVREVKNTETDENPQGEQRQNQPDCPGADEEGHAPPLSAAISVIGPIQHAPRTNSLCPAPAISRSSLSRCNTPCRVSASNKVETVVFTSSAPFCRGR